MNHKILEILPKKQTPELLYPAYNQAIEEVTEALKKNEVCVCPSEEEILYTLKEHFTNRGDSHLAFQATVSVFDLKEQAKAIRKLILEGK